ncbi:inorganic diphosphatase [Sinimarinibacterium sp. CAU 1509]|uniref:inorganic diphosphatase n=1 Tax=Sinimarinibacterium sp. CAU 1509 TaxID=2562283 RepID=UPI0010AC4890|nr:inorganic diphosphatase [Sinimarinibacterium sp. CAU 1509]TJY65118.1 inorganic diphosphatase [Sinimarinibacterium sp. CAU 1509]
MGFEALGPGDKAPNEFIVVIEIPAYGPPVKYEVDKETGLLTVDRFMNVSMCYPANYGYIPKTLAGDGDPVDVLVLTPHPIVAGSVIKCRAVAVLDTEDEGGTDAKLLAVPTDKVSNGAYDHLRDLADVPERLQNEIRHFYERYKDLEKGKWVKVSGWRDAAAARGEIEAGIKAYKG